MIAFLALKLRRKLGQISAILIPALAVSLLLGGLLVVATPLLPTTWQDMLAFLRTATQSADAEELRSFLAATGLRPQTMFFILQFMQVLLAPIPGHLLALLGGYLFGFWQGLLVSMAALMIGATILMLAGRMVGERIARHFVPTEVMSRFDQNIMARGGVSSFFLFFLLPVFPDDALCFIAGVTRLSIPKLLLASLIGRIPGIAVLTYIGAHGDLNALWMRIAFGILIVLVVAIWLFEEELWERIKQL